LCADPNGRIGHESRNHSRCVWLSSDQKVYLPGWFLEVPQWRSGIANWELRLENAKKRAYAIEGQETESSE